MVLLLFTVCRCLAVTFELLTIVVAYILMMCLHWCNVFNVLDALHCVSSEAQASSQYGCSTAHVMLCCDALHHTQRTLAN